MKTTDLFKNARSSQRINEGLEKYFGKKINLETFDLPQLEDARNKLRTQISQIRSGSSFNENLENDAFTQAQWMLDAINSEIAEREEFIADPISDEVEEEVGFDDVNGKTAAYILRKLDQGVEISELLDDFPELGRMMDTIAGEMHLHPDDDFEEIENALISELENKADEHDKGYEETFYDQESTQGDDMKQVTEGEIQQASAIVTAKTMVDRVGRWIEELSGMENETLLQLGDQVRDEMGSEMAKNFISTAAPAIQDALSTLKQARETLATGVRTLTGEEQPAEMLGDSPSGEEEIGAAEPDMMNAGEEEMPPEDEFAAAEPAAGGLETAGREKRESIEFQNKLLKVLAG